MIILKVSLTRFEKRCILYHCLGMSVHTSILTILKFLHIKEIFLTFLVAHFKTRLNETILKIFTDVFPYLKILILQGSHLLKQ